MSVLVFQRLVIKFFLNILYTPLWWYSRGLKRAFDFCLHLLKMGNKNLVPMLWLKNIFTPMFGQTDWQGKIVSFLVRIANVFGRSLALFIWFFIVTFIFLLWIATPIFVAVMFLFSLIS